jgi:hypothetical protein
MMARFLRVLAPIFLILIAPSAGAQTNRAEGFSKLPPGAKIALMPVDIELFEVAAGGVAEPRADWTTSALRHIKDLYRERKARMGAQIVDMEDDSSEQVAELNRLHGAVGGAIAAHHFGFLKLATKEGKLDWSLGPDARLLRERSGADFALFTFMRDSYASSERAAAVIVAALFGVGMHSGAIQHGYASLVDLATGRVLWFNRLIRGTGDLREREKAAETLEALLTGFPQ